MGSQPKPVDKLQVTREQDQADGVDQTLPRNDTVETLIDHGKPSFGVGAVCKTSSECSSKMCGGGHCCSVDANGCTGNGICNELGNCVCKEGWFGPQCNRDSNITVGKEFDGNSTAELEKGVIKEHGRRNEKRAGGRQRKHAFESNARKERN